VLRGLIEAAEGLVDTQDGKGPDEAQSDAGLLAQTSAERGREVLGPVIQPEVLDEGPPALVLSSTYVFRLFTIQYALDRREVLSAGIE